VRGLCHFVISSNSLSHATKLIQHACMHTNDDSLSHVFYHFVISITLQIPFTYNEAHIVRMHAHGYLVFPIILSFNFLSI
jgi:hypothetical protein